MLGVIHGRLTRDPEIKDYKNKDGQDGQLCNFTVAADNRYGNKTDASFYNCTVFGKRAAAVKKFLNKGSEIVVTGYHEQEEYQDKNGDNKRTWRFSVIDFDFCGKKAEGNKSDAPEGFEPVDDGDIPF